MRRLCGEKNLEELQAVNKKELEELVSRNVVDPNIEPPGWFQSAPVKNLIMAGAGLLVLLLLVGIFNKDGIWEVLESRREVLALKASIARLEKENSLLVQEIDALKNDPRYLEKIAREDLGLARPGETIFVFPDS